MVSDDKRLIYFTIKPFTVIYSRVVFILLVVILPKFASTPLIEDCFSRREQTLSSKILTNVSFADWICFEQLAILISQNGPCSQGESATLLYIDHLAS